MCKFKSLLLLTVLCSVLACGKTTETTEDATDVEGTDVTVPVDATPVDAAVDATPVDAAVDVSADVTKA